MKLFKNGVGRPSNKTIRKRKFLKLGVILGSLFFISTFFVLGYFNIINLRGFAAKQKVTLCKDTEIYLTAKTKIHYNSSGTYYIWGSMISNGRIRITKIKSFAGKKGLAAGWVKTSSLTSCSNEEPQYNLGDVNMDGKITNDDSELVLQYLSGTKKLNNEQLKLADVNKDGKITTTDGRLITQMISNELAITMTELDKTWIVGDVKTVNVTLNNSGDSYDVSTSNPSVIKISSKNSRSFKLTALAPGTSVITATSKKTGQRVSYEYTVKRNPGSDENLVIDISFAGELNSNGVYMFDSAGNKKVDVTLNNNTGESRYYRWFLYSGKVNSNGTVSINGDPYYVRNCNSYNEKTTINSQSNLSSSAPLKVMVARSYSTKSECDADSVGKSTKYVSEKKAYYGLKSSLVKISMTPEGSTGGNGIWYVSSDKDYNVNVKLNNYTTKNLYYRWFTYMSHDSSKNPHYYAKDSKEACYTLNSTAEKNWKIGVSWKNSKSAGRVKVYSNKSSCEADDNSTSTSNVVASKSIKYEFSKTYTSNGFKAIRFDNAVLSEKIGPQEPNKCHLASAAYAAYIISNGNCVISSTRSNVSGMGGEKYDYSNVNDIWNIIVKKIDAGIPLVIRVTANRRGGGTGEHWLTVVGYYTGTKSSLTATNIRNYLYIIDPGEASFENGRLFFGVGSEKPTSFNSLRKYSGKYQVASWASIDSFKCPK